MIEIERNKIYHGHTLDILRQFPDECINMTVTSPPYYSKRKYGTSPTIWDGDPECEHSWQVHITPKQRGSMGTSEEAWHRPSRRENPGNKTQYTMICKECGAWRGELGLEPRIDMYIDHLFQIFEELYRVTRKDGCFFLNMGDTYYGGNPTTKGKQDYIEEHWPTKRAVSSGRELPKTCMCMIPERIALRMITDGKWVLHNEVIWHKPNAMPKSVKKRYTDDFEKLYFFTKSKKYHFEQQFEPFVDGVKWDKRVRATKEDSKYDDKDGSYSIYDMRGKKIRPNPWGRNKRTVWSICTTPFRGSHFATFPKELVTSPIKAGCPDQVCISCDTPVLKKFLKIEVIDDDGKIDYERHVETVKCDCEEDYRPGIVLDPFMGSGTTALVARELGRDFVGIDLNKEYIEMAYKRLGMNDDV